MRKLKRSTSLILLRRVSMILLGAIGISYILTVVMPYLLLRLHNPHLANLYDPKSYAFFKFTPFYITAMLSLAMVYIVGILLLPINVSLLLIGWRGMRLWERLLNTTLWLLGATILAFILSPLGQTISVWLLD